MHVAVDAHNLLSDRRGIGVYVRALLTRWLERDSCELTLVVRHPFPPLVKRRLAHLLRSKRFAISRRVPRGCDVLWHPWNGTFVEGARKNVATIHDVTPFALPEPDQRKREHQQQPFLRTAVVADRIMTDSVFSRDEIERYLDVPRDRMTVVPLAADAIFTPGSAEQLPPHLQSGRYVVFVGGDERRKNLRTLLEAWSGVFAEFGAALTVVSREPIADVREGMVLVRDADNTRLRDLYRGALCVAVPSLYEGFGLPALEAMACGAPVVASRAASLPEVCGDAALYVENPLDVEEWSAALTRIQQDEALRRDLSGRGLIRAREFSWDRTANEALAVLKRAVRG